MTLRNAIIEIQKERFSHDRTYLEDKLIQIKECKHTHQLLYLCMNIDTEGLDMLSEKLNFTSFKTFLWAYQVIDQGGRFSL